MATHIFDRDWDEYDNKFIDYLLTINQMVLLSSIAGELFDNFPENLPGDLFGPIFAKRSKLLRDEMDKRGINYSEAEYDITYDEFYDELGEIQLSPKQEKWYNLYFSIYQTSRHFKKYPEYEYPEFVVINISLEITFVYALTEGFISESIRFALANKPDLIEILIKDYKKLNFADDDPLEQLVFVLGYGNLVNKIRRLNNKFGLAIRLSEREITELNEISIIRNSIVHNNSLVNQQYIDFYENSQLEIGVPIDFDRVRIEQLLDNMVDVSYKIYKSIAMKILGKNEELLLPEPGIA